MSFERGKSIAVVERSVTRNVAFVPSDAASSRRSRAFPPRRSIFGFSALLALSISGVPNIARATLGEMRESVAQDRATVRGTSTVVPMRNFEVHEITAASRATFREYVNPSGRVFAMAWNASQVPDLKLLLGSYYDRYVAEARIHRTGHHVLSIVTPELVMSVVKNQRASSGQVILPPLTPSGVSREELR